jgi:hypothetical protein
MELSRQTTAFDLCYEALENGKLGACAGGSHRMGKVEWVNVSDKCTEKAKWKWRGL